jgi:hypothetical protein
VQTGSHIIGGLTGAGITSISAGARLNVGQMSQDTLNLSGSAVIRANASLTHRTSTIGTLNLAGTTGNWTGLLNLNNNNLIVHNGTQLPDQIKQAAHLGAWNSTAGGITSSSALAASTSSTATALAYASGADFMAGNGQTRFDSQPYSPNDTLIMYTLAGDANMDASVTFADFLQLQNHYNQVNTDWEQGDWNYDGSTTFADFLILQNNYNKTMTVGSLQQGASGAVPEPTTILLLLIPLTLTRRRRAQINTQ